jgi:hypothetical protein
MMLIAVKTDERLPQEYQFWQFDKKQPSLI